MSIQFINSIIMLKPNCFGEFYGDPKRQVLDGCVEVYPFCKVVNYTLVKGLTGKF